MKKPKVSLARTEASVTADEVQNGYSRRQKRIRLLNEKLENFRQKNFSDAATLKAASDALHSEIQDLRKEVHAVRVRDDLNPTIEVRIERQFREGSALHSKLRRYVREQRNGIKDASLPLDDEFWQDEEELRKPGEELLRREPEGDLREDELRAQIKAKVDELSGQPLAHVWNALVAQKPASESKPIPTEPPGGQLYADRPRKSENAPAFIQRVYGPWLDGSFTRADLRRIDPGAMNGLKNWEARFGRTDILPTKKERTDKLANEPMPDEFAERWRALNAARVRKSRSRTK